MSLYPDSLNAQEIRNACIKAGSLHEAAKLLDINYKSMRKYAKALGIPAGLKDHGNRYSSYTADDVRENYLSNKKSVTSSQLREMLIRTGIKERKCERCGLSEWLGNAIPLELHHINENHYDNSETNLMIVCPTCHAQITWQDKIDSDIARMQERRNKEKLKRLYREIGAPPEAIKGVKFNCSVQELLSLLEIQGTWTGVARHFGVTMSSIKRRCIRLGIMDKATGIIQRKKKERMEERLKDLRESAPTTDTVSIPVEQLDIKTMQIIKVYKSTHATKKDGFHVAHVAECCKGKRNQHKGFIWKYHEQV